METYKYAVALMVEVEAFDEADAFDAIQEMFGVGSTGAVTVTQCDYEETPKKRR